MELLLTGNVSPRSDGILRHQKKAYTCICFGSEEKWEELERTYSTYDFDAVIYLSMTLENEENIFDETKYLEMTLELCRKHKVHKFIYIISNALTKESEASKSNLNILYDACESLCMEFAREGEHQVTMLKVPFLYSMQFTDNTLSNWVKDAIEKQEVSLPSDRIVLTDFLCEEDLGEILNRIVDKKQEKQYQMIVLSGNNDYTIEQVGQMLREQIPGTIVSFDKQVSYVPTSMKEETAKKQYGFVPKHKLTEDLPVLIRRRKKQLKKQEGKKEKLIHFKYGSYAKSVAELGLMFVITVLLSMWTRDNIMISFLDFRFLFVVAVGLRGGLSAGLLAAVLSCGDYVYENVVSMHLDIVFCNVQNWLVFASYLLLGAITGHIKDKHDNELKFVKEEKELLEKKYIILNEQYVKVLESKEGYNNQIIGYQDSFGKLYSIVKKLDSTLSSEVFYEAVNVMEEMLENNSVAIYSIPKMGDYARLSVCSKPLYNKLGKSLVLSQYPDMIKQLRENKAFVNMACKEGYPVYAAPIYRDDELLGMILLMNVQEGQMTKEFSNQFFILSELIKDSLIRAMEQEH